MATLKRNIAKNIYKFPEWTLITLLLLLQGLIVGEEPFLCFGKKDQLECERKISRLVPFNPGSISQPARLKPPLSYTSGKIHWMGTDHLGRDIAALWIRAFYFSFTLSLVAGIFALFIAMTLGGMAAIYKNSFPSSPLWLTTPILGFMLFIFLLLSYQINFLLNKYLLGSNLILIVLFFVIGHNISQILRKKLGIQSIAFPADRFILGVIEIMESLPGLLIILTLAVMIDFESHWQIALVFGAMGWMSMARFIRSEGRNILKRKYIQDYLRLDFKPFKIFLRHIWPELLMSTAIVFVYTIAAFIIAESFLSFVGIGLPAEFSSWGHMLNDARRFPEAWWMGLFPGIGIFFLVLAYYRMARYIERRIF